MNTHCEMEFQAALDLSVSTLRLFLRRTLRRFFTVVLQVEAVKSFISGKDTFVILPTGVIYYVTGFAKTDRIV